MGWAYTSESLTTRDELECGSDDEEEVAGEESKLDCCSALDSRTPKTLAPGERGTTGGVI
jgi:hypothetical protein